jgi:CheY-like chemotaxis protein
MNLGAPVLIIDDDPAMTDAVRDILELAGQPTAVARNAFHGLKLAREVRPAVVLCDMFMPDMAGSDVFRELAADPATAHIPRVMMSGYPNADRSLADGFMPKPFDPFFMLNLLQEMASLPKVTRRQLKPVAAQWRG